MLEPDDQEKCDPEKYIRPGDKDLVVQLVLSLIIGVSSFLAFCVRNPSLQTFRWIARLTTDTLHRYCAHDGPNSTPPASAVSSPSPR